MRLDSLARQWLAFALLSVAAATGCEKGYLGGMPQSGTGGSSGSAESASCAAVMGSDGSVCKQCVDATGVVVYDSCAPATTGGAGTPGSGGTGAAGTGGAAGGSGGAACGKIKGGGPTSCKDAGTWKMYGTAACAQQNLTLTDISWDVACANGDFEAVTYVCCGGCATAVDANGQTCTTCTDATGAIISSACSAGGVTCQESTDPSGLHCKTCSFPDGKILSSECDSDGGSGATEICDVRSTPDGSACKVCYEPDGSMLSTCPG
jgi:hypothetical protein